MMNNHKHGTLGFPVLRIWNIKVPHIGMHDPVAVCEVDRKSGYCELVLQIQETETRFSIQLFLIITFSN
jgi:hypothetical protein